MNLSTIALALLAWQLLAPQNNSNKKQSSPLGGLSSLLNDDSKNLVDCVQKLTSTDATQQDKTGALLQMMTNPTVMDLAQNLFAKKKEQQAPSPQSAAPQNEEGYVFETPSAGAQQFFAPVNDIADAEVKHKLYWFYDNWYTSK